MEPWSVKVNIKINIQTRGAYCHDGRFADVHWVDGTPIQDATKASSPQYVACRQLRDRHALVLSSGLFQDFKRS